MKFNRSDGVELRRRERAGRERALLARLWVRSILRASCVDASRRSRSMRERDRAELLHRQHLPARADAAGARCDRARARRAAVCHRGAGARQRLARRLCRGRADSPGARFLGGRAVWQRTNRWQPAEWRDDRAVTTTGQGTQRFRAVAPCAWALCAAAQRGLRAAAGRDARAARGARAAPRRRLRGAKLLRPVGRYRAGSTRLRAPSPTLRRLGSSKPARGAFPRR